MDPVMVRSCSATLKTFHDSSSGKNLFGFIGVALAEGLNSEQDQALFDCQSLLQSGLKI